MLPPIAKEYFYVVPNAAAAEHLVAKLRRARAVAVDTETTGLDPWRSEGRLLQLAGRGLAFIIDLWQLDPQIVAPLFTEEDGPILVGHNWSFDLKVLQRLGIHVTNGRRLFDTQLAQQLLDARAKKPSDADDEEFEDDDEELVKVPSLKELAQRHLGITLHKDVDHDVWAQPALPLEALTYAATDAAVLLPLYEILAPRLEEARLDRVRDAEMRCLPAVAWLELTGAPFDEAGWRTLSDAALREQLELEDRLNKVVRDYAPTEEWRRVLLDLKTAAHQERFPDQAPELVSRWRRTHERKLAQKEHVDSWESNQQVRALFLARGLDLASTDKDTLWRLVADGDPLAQLLLDYRDAVARATRYGIKVLALVNPVTHRLHTTYWQLGSSAGRFSSSNPNLQNIPRDERYRACIRPAPGRVLVKADYNQIELRLAAQIAPDEVMLEAYKAGKDLHTVTAALILGADEDRVTKEQRQRAKAINFGFLYGMGIAKFRRTAASTYKAIFSEEEAIELRNRWRNEYQGIYAWQCRRAGTYGTYTPMETRTLLDRRRRLVYRYTEQLNSPVQGSGADGLKLALALLWERRHQAPTAVPVLCVHDEIVVECDEERTDETKAWLRSCMQEGMAEVLTELEPKVELDVYRDWGVTKVERQKGG